MSNSRVLPMKNGAPATRRERRVAVRYPGNPDAECRTYAPLAGVYAAWVRDISTTGVSLLIACEFEPGAFLTIELQNLEQGITCVLRARVVHTLEVPPDERWLHGCEFERPLSDEELQAFAE